MKYTVKAPARVLNAEITLDSSKSISNRLLIIQALSKSPFTINNLSLSDDTSILKSIIDKVKTGPQKQNFDVGHAGTAMRFLTAYLATTPGEWTLTGSDRMKKRPIKPLVDTLIQLGADIKYLEQEGFAPLQINGKLLKGGEVTLDASLSSQYASALLMVAPCFVQGLVLHFENSIASPSYINLTLKLMEKFSVYGMWNNGAVSVSSQQYGFAEEDEKEKGVTVEPDWSSASYWYAICALAPEGSKIKLNGFKEFSMQADAICSSLFTFYGVNSVFPENENYVLLTKKNFKPKQFVFDFSDCPDIAQTCAVVAFGLDMPFVYNGLATLRVKETDRIEALTTELLKAGAKIDGSASTLEMKAVELNNNPQTFETYNDHRMAMAFAPLSLRFDEVIINNPGVVSKSYPKFWDDLKSVGFQVNEV